jgi:pSer/pThr/pTyr-binding forkhead associated (FHA) protein
MADLDFPTWFGIGSYGGLVVSLLAAVAIVLYALLRHRGTPRQLARSILVCLFASCLMLAPVWWNQNRLDFYGPSLGDGETTFWLAWTALFGWALPLGLLAGYLALAGPQVAMLGRSGVGSLFAPAGLSDPARRYEPLGAGRAWGRLISLDGTFAKQPLPLTRQLTLFGRELDNDVIVDDDLVSRRHAEVRWDHGRVHVRDAGSMNGTLVNGQSARGALPLHSGDVLQLGTRSYRFELLTSGALMPIIGDAADKETQKVPGVSVRTSTLPSLALVGTGVVAGARWQLDEPLITVGRDGSCGIVLPDESVSRIHAQIVRQQTGYYVSDLDSSNGTQLNGAPLDAPALLSAGDVLCFGAVELRCAPPIALAPPTVPLDEHVSAALSAGVGDISSSSRQTPPLRTPLGATIAHAPYPTPAPSRLAPPRLRSAEGFLPPGGMEADV